MLLGGAWLAEVPASALGVAADSLSTGLPALAVGVAAGVGLSLANALAGGLAERFNGDPSEELRELLSPESLGGWVVLLGVVLPIIAGFEELLFRGGASSAP
ncbi:CPBP family intramembrane metalloprotease, partial [Natronomonas sp. CBA1123]|nr:CPBP family intramembrane metalloprotease [Natronomonas sp. CBA1123]